MAALARSKKRWLSIQAKSLAKTVGLADPEDAIRKMVVDLLDEAEQKEAPINLPLVASFRGVVEIRTESINGPAMLLPTAQGLMILVNSADTPGRRNFSTAHEICHTFFHDDVAPAVEADRSIGQFYIGLEEEYLCDIGASTLLLPPHLVSDKISSHGCCLNAILRLAEEFESSIEAAAIAWVQAAPWTCAVVFFEEKLKPSQLKRKNQTSFLGMEDMLPQNELRITHARASCSFPFFLPKDKSAGKDGPIHRCMAEQKTVGTDTLELHGDIKSIHTESVFAPYRKDGELTKRVVSLIRPI